MNMFEKWKDRYERYWCTKDQLKRLVQLKIFTAAQYKEITGEDYER